MTRTFEFNKANGQWTVNGQIMPADCSVARFTVQKNSVEKWILKGGRDWVHPVHIHFEEFQILRRDRNLVTSGVEYSRKDVVDLTEGGEIELHVMHCHNTIHEDHAMMLRWDIADVGDTKGNP